MLLLSGKLILRGNNSDPWQSWRIGIQRTEPIEHWVRPSASRIFFVTNFYSDRHYEMRQLRIFQKMVAKGLIYRQHRPVHYSPSSRSALAEAELEYVDKHVSHSVYVAFDLDEATVSRIPILKELHSKNTKVQLLVWTTTPWTLTANMVRLHRTVRAYI